MLSTHMINLDSLILVSIYIPLEDLSEDNAISPKMKNHLSLITIFQR